MLKIRMTTDNEVFRGRKWAETARTLRELANRLDRESDNYIGTLNLFDENGNRIGHATLT